MNLIEYPDSSLRRVCNKIDVIDDDVIDAVFDMISSLRESNLNSISAPQCGIPLRLFVATNLNGDVITFLNPSIYITDFKLVTFTETCSSMLNNKIDVERFQSVNIDATDIDGNDFSMECSGSFASQIQHEFDHLNGILCIDRVEPYLKRKIASEIWNRKFQ